MGRSKFERVTRPEAQRERPETVRVWLLGGFRVSVGSRTIEESQWRLRKAAALVKLLALAPRHRMHREQAMDLLWPELSKKATSNNLRQVLYDARKTLNSTVGSRYLASEEESLTLCPEGQLWVDVDAFEEAAQTARRACDPAVYRVAIDLYTGDLLPQDRYEVWAEARREELRQLYLALLVEIAGPYEERGELGLAIEALRKATAKEPTLEEAHASLMRLHALTGATRSAPVDDLVDVAVGPTEVGPCSIFRTLDRSQELYVLGLHLGAGLVNIIHPEAHDGSRSEEGVELLLGTPHLHLGAVWEPEADYVALVPSLLQPHHAPKELCCLLNPLCANAQPS